MESKAYHLGTHRVITPQDTLKRVQPLLKTMGITRAANVTGLDRVGIPVYTAFRPQSRSISVSQGKGFELDAAKASAIMESVETFHAETITAPLRYGSLAQLQEDIPLADVSQLPRIGTQHLNQHQAIYWIEGRNLMDDQPCWVPFEMVSTDYTLPYVKGSGYFAANTNGLASGNTLNEAICHAIFEVVERDAEALWHQQAVSAQINTGVDIDSIDDKNCRWLIEKFEQADIEIKIWDMSSDVGLPSYICLAMGDKNDWADPEFGAGCHAAKEIALSRALTEAAQARATYIAGSRDDVGLSEYKIRQRQKRRYQGLAQIQKYQAKQDFSARTSFNNPHIDDDLKLCLERLSAVGITQVIAVDLSKAALGLSVAKVVIPGLEGAFGHWHSSYTPGPRAKAVQNLPFDIPGMRDGR